MDICGIISNSGPNREPLACGYLPEHEGAHAWATLPTFPIPVESVATERQHRALDQYYSVQIEADMEQTIADLKLAMTEAMTSMRLSGVTDFAYQRLAVALERVEGNR